MTDLAKRIEDGEFDPVVWEKIYMKLGWLSGGPERGWLLDAWMHGSLDAAKTLHEAVLPEWDIMVHTYDDDLFEGSVAEPDKVQTFDGQSTSMARAWLIAIIKALIAKETT